jgi:8-oxo-dGTP pyrophosphatase MutT (NUDIX family)
VSGLIEREAVRALILTPAAETLILRIRHPDGHCFWIAPGGGREVGEDDAATLARELQEELGLLSFEMGPCIWMRQHTFTWRDKRYRQDERYRIVHAPRFDPVMSDAHEATTLEEFRWLHVSALADITERLTPLSLPTILARYLSHGAPTAPLEKEVLID